MALPRRCWIYLGLSIPLLAPVYWQPRLQAGDLSSHVYNAWLAQLIESGHAPGLALAGQTSNVLFDLLLAALFRLGGPGIAQRVAVSIAVLVFVWGAFRFTAAVSGRRPWHVLPCIAMLAYGWVFHMGFFNFYLSLGLCLWALAAVWSGGWRNLAIAISLMLLAYTAHAMPVAWALGLGVYRFAAVRTSAIARTGFTGGCLLAMLALHGVMAARRIPVRWSPRQIGMATGADQLWVFDDKYYLAVLGLLAVWALLLAALVCGAGVRATVAGIPFQLCVISAGIVTLLPAAVTLPGYHASLTFVAQRMSLAVAICVCAMLATACPRAFERYAVVAVAAVFFGFIYRDERMLNGLEDRMERALAGLQPGARVVSGIEDTSLHTVAVNHMIDRLCVGRCFSYANYEPSTGAFRVRATGVNSLVMAEYRDCWKLQMGRYVVKASDPPLTELVMDSAGRFSLRNLKAGMPCGSTSLKALTG